MTREEAIKRLRGIPTEAVEFENSVCYVTEEDREPLEMAIKVLEQEPCEDAISREFLELVVQYPPKDLCTYPEYRDKPYYSIKYYENGECYVGYGTYNPEVLSRFLKDYFITPVNPQPKTGHWTRELIRNEKGGCIGAKMICSECGNDNKHDEYMNYCPNCGAKMVKPQESEDK